MRISRALVGRSPGHALQPSTDVVAFSVDGDRISVTISALGASLVSVVVPDRDGAMADVVLGDPAVATGRGRGEAGYLGSTMGRYARCIADARLELDGVVHHLDANDPPHHVHGGTFGFDAFVWDADAEQRGDTAEVVLRLARPDGDQGYPGAISATTTYRVHPDGVLEFEHTATTTAPTVVDMTNHAYWNLAGGGTVDAHELAIGADRVLLVEDGPVPAGDPVPVARGPFDFRAGHAIGETRLDNCFVWSMSPGLVARLVDPSSGRALALETDQPGLQVYTGDALALPRSGICLQTGSWPDAPSRQHFPSARLDPGAVYRHCTRCGFSAR